MKVLAQEAQEGGKDSAIDSGPAKQEVQSGRPSIAEQHLRKALEYQPYSSAAHRDLAQLLCTAEKV